MNDQVRQLVGLENLLVKARRRHRECEREEASTDGPGSGRYRDLIKRLSDEIHEAGREHLEKYLAYVEEDLILRIARKVETAKEEMLAAARKVAEQRFQLQELRTAYADALERSRSLRERLGLDPFRPLDVHFGLGPRPPLGDRTLREAHDLVKEYLKS